jgi:MFS family permease
VPRSLLTQNRPVLSLLIVQLLSGIVLLPLGLFFPIYLEEQLGYTAAFLSAFVAVGRFLGMIASAVGGALADAVGRKGTLVLGLAGIMLGSLMYLTRSPWLVFVIWSVGGIGGGLHTVGGQSYLIDAAGSQHLGVFSALYHWGFTLGGALSSPGAGLLLEKGGFESFGLALLGISLATTVGAIAILPGLRRGIGASATSWSGTLFGYREVLRRQAVRLLGLLRFLPTCYYGMASVLNPLLINRAADSKTAVAAYGTITLVAATLAQILAGRGADHWGSRRPTLFTYEILVIAILGQAVFAAHLWSYYVFGVLGICAAWALSTLMPVLVSEVTSAAERGRVLGAQHLLWNVGMMLGPVVGGALMEINLGLPFYVVGLLNVFAILVALAFFDMAPRPVGDVT